MSKWTSSPTQISSLSIAQWASLIEKQPIKFSKLYYEIVFQLAEKFRAEIIQRTTKWLAGVFAPQLAAHESRMEFTNFPAKQSSWTCALGFEFWIRSKLEIFFFSSDLWRLTRFRYSTITDSLSFYPMISWSENLMVSTFSFVDRFDVPGQICSKKTYLPFYWPWSQSVRFSPRPFERISPDSDECIGH